MRKTSRPQEPQQSQHPRQPLPHAHSQSGGAAVGHHRRQDRPQHPPTVHREGREEVKPRQKQVGDGQVGQQVRPGERSAGRKGAQKIGPYPQGEKEQCEERQTDTDDPAGHRPGQRHQQLLIGTVRDTFHLGHPAQGEQSDFVDAPAELNGEQTVGQFVEDHADEEKQGHHHPE
jgi:hypothetical protein